MTIGAFVSGFGPILTVLRICAEGNPVVHPEHDAHREQQR
jgi:hypothetical protein